MNYSQVIISPQAITSNIDYMPEILGGSHIIAGTKQDFSNPDIIVEHRNIRNYATCEPAQYLLDGSMADIPDVSEGDIGFCGAEMSGADGSLLTPVQYEAYLIMTDIIPGSYSYGDDFGGHTSDGITLFFKEGEWCPSINIKWYSVDFFGAKTLLSDKDFTPYSERYFCANAVTGYGYILITLNSTFPAYRYPKLESIELGNNITFKKDELTANKIYEEVSPLSIELPGCNGEFTVLTEKKVDLVASDSIISNLEEFTPVDYFYKKDGILKYFGRQFLSEWESNDEKRMTFKSVSQVEKMSNAEYDGSMDTSADGFGAVVPLIMADLKHSHDYEYNDDAVEWYEKYTGYIPKGTQQESIRAVAFASFRTVDTTRSDRVNIRKQVNGNVRDLAKSRIIVGGLANTEIKNLARVTMTLSTYKVGATAEELYSEALSAGTHKVEFSEPVSTVTLSSTYEIEYAFPDFAIVVLDSAGTLTITGKKYNESFRTLEKKATVSGTPYEISAGGIYLKHEPQTLIDNVFDFYSEQYTYEFDMILEKEKCLDWIAVPIRDNYKLQGQINSLEIDFVNGLKTHAKVVGKVVAV